MKIGVVTEHYYPSLGGVQEHVHHFAREARRFGHHVKILTSEMPDLPQPGGEAADRDVVRLGRSRPIFVDGGFGRVTVGGGLSRRLRGVLERERFDVLDVHCPLTPVLPLLALHYADGPVVGTFHDRLRPGVAFRLARRTLQRHLDRLDAPVAVSRACLEGFEGRLAGEFHIIPGGVDLERFGRGRPLRRFEDGKLNLLWAGRTAPHDGLDRMLAAFVKAWKEIDCRLLVVGGGPLLPRYRAMVPREVEGDVVFAGPALDDRPDWYATADVCCAPASVATTGTALLEAMAAGKPVLASNLGAFREVMAHGREGELLPAGDADAWARAIVQLAREPARAQGFAEAGKLTARHYAWPLVAREILGLYRQVGARG